jgi:Domain of unknown function (DUF4202)
MNPTSRLEAVLARIDEANASDPNEEMVEGSPQPAALLYGHRMSTVLEEFAPGASEHLKIAVRGQHIERWKRARHDYPEGREGYLAWRTDAARYHAERIGELMKLEGYDDQDCARVADLVRKRAIKRDPEAQTLEDVACLVFMRWYFVPFVPTRTPDELFRIVAKTARKMSGAGRQAALQLPLPPELVPAITSSD